MHVTTKSIILSVITYFATGFSISIILDYRYFGQLYLYYFISYIFGNWSIFVLDPLIEHYNYNSIITLPFSTRLFIIVDRIFISRIPRVLRIYDYGCKTKYTNIRLHYCFKNYVMKRIIVCLQGV